MKMKMKVVVLLSLVLIMCSLLCACGGSSGNTNVNPNDGKLLITEEIKRDMEEELEPDDTFGGLSGLELLLAVEAQTEVTLAQSNLDIKYSRITKCEQEDDYNYKVWVVYVVEDPYGDEGEIKSTANIYYVEDSEAEEGYRMKRDVSAIRSSLR